MRRCQPETRLDKQAGDQIVVPLKHRQHIIEIGHDKTGHLGFQKTKDRISQHFYWPNIITTTLRLTVKLVINVNFCQKVNIYKNSC